MLPIVDRLEEAYDQRVTFVRFNARDGAEGEALFQQLSLPGHPSFALFAADARELERGVGVIAEAELRRMLEMALVETAISIPIA